MAKISLRIPVGAALLALVVLAPAVVDAPGARADEAEDLRASIEEALALAGLAGEVPGAALSYEDLRITPREGSFLVEVTGLQTVTSDLGHAIALPAVSLTMTPLGEGAYRAEDLRLDGPVVARDEAGQIRGRLTFEALEFAGTWSSRYLFFTDGRLIAEAARLIGVGSDWTAEAAAPRLRWDSNELSPGIVDIAASMSLGPVAVRAEGRTPFMLERLELSSTLEAVEYERQLAARRRLAELGLSGDPNAELSAAERQELAAVMVELIESFSKSSRARFSMSELRIADEGTRLELGEAAYDYGIALPEEEGADGTLTASVSFSDFGLFLPGAADPFLPPMLPKDFLFDFAVTKLPGDILDRLAGQMAEAMVAAEPGLAEPTLENAGDAALRSMIEHGTTFELRDLRLVTALANFAVTGQLTMDERSPNNVSGRFQGQLAGLDRMMLYAQQLMGAADEKSQEAAEALMSFAFVMSAMGEPSQLDDGTRVLSYDLQVTPEGQALLNGKPLGDLPGLKGAPLTPVVPESDPPAEPDTGSGAQ